MHDHEFKLEEFELGHFLTLMDTYLSEWKHRDELLWKQIFTYFYATIFILFLPNIAERVGIDLPDFPLIIFPLTAMVLSVVFLYVGIGYAKRLEAIGETYNDFIALLPETLQRISLDNPRIKLGKYFKPRMSIVICLIMFLGLFAVSVTMVIYYLC